MVGWTILVVPRGTVPVMGGTIPIMGGGGAIPIVPGRTVPVVVGAGHHLRLAVLNLEQVSMAGLRPPRRIYRRAPGMRN